MENIQTRPALINPSGIYCYTDKIQVWLRDPLHREALRWLRTQCGLHVSNRPKQFEKAYQQRLQLHQPSDAALTWLGDRNDTCLNYAEFALDLTFDDAEAKQAAFRHIAYHHIKPWHGKQSVMFVGEKDNVTRYSGQRKTTNQIVIYADKPCRITGEVDCLHIEWRTRGQRALKALGIDNCRDLSKVDHGQQWRKWLRLCRYDPIKVGHVYNNRMSSRSRHGRWLDKTASGFVYDLDRRGGAIIINAFETVQDMKDQTTYPASCLIKLPVSHLLPQPSENGVCE